MTTRPRPAPLWRAWRSNSHRQGNGTVADRRTAPTSTACGPSPGPAPHTLTGDRDKALTLTGLHYASRSQDPAGLLTGDVTLHPRGMVVAVLTGKTRHSVRNAKIRYADDPEICPVRAWTAYRTRLVAEHGPQWADPSTPAFVGIDQWGHVTGGMVPDSVTRALTRTSSRAGVPIAWTVHFLRIGLASVARRKGRDDIAIADQGGWAPHSRSMLGSMQRDDG